MIAPVQRRLPGSVSRRGRAADGEEDAETKGGVMNRCIDCGRTLEPEFDYGKFPKGIESCRAYREWAEKEMASYHFDLGKQGAPEVFQIAMGLFVQQCDVRRDQRAIAASN
jgi:hypothetical protein